MDLGACSVSLAVKDLAASRSFYETLGFTAFAGDPAQHWLIMCRGRVGRGGGQPSPGAPVRQGLVRYPSEFGGTMDGPP